ncbi:unnamed protein product [Rotaria sordida]|uniref:PiggyBac transposable element-derived protein domain-containing protein n=1 Tax=Rotaria sordida TaxID=392033 RepID=A0A819TW53_9BILA|nr:unnamed protein product [Rotaria sordida]CAF4093696.1 unnamed protein product [Rotaria sordida]
MNTTQKSNLKRIRDILLTDEHEINNNFSDNQGSDSDSEYDFVATESDDTSNSEHISEESDLSNSDTEQDDVVTANQPETLQKDDPGPTIKIQTILDAFKLFSTNEILDQIVLHTNLYAKRYFDQKIRSQQDSNSIRLDSHCWKPIDRIELESFIGLLIQSVVNRSNHELFFDLCNISRSRPLYRVTVSLQLFKHLLQFIRFDDQETRDKSDHLGPIRFDHLPNNVKQGRYITFDRYFTHIKLSEALLDRKMTSIGVIEHRRSFLPDELKVCRRNLFSSWFYFSGPHMLLSYQAKEKKPDHHLIFVG